MNRASDLDRAAREWPQKAALYFEGPEQQWTYAELDARASRIATGLEAEGVRPGDRVAIIMSNLPEHVASWYGIAKAGAIPVDVNYILADEEWTFILDDCEPKAILTDMRFGERVAGVAGRVSSRPVVFVARREGDLGDGALEDLGRGTGPRPAMDRDPDDVAVLAYTSGTTGYPKGVMHSQRILEFQMGTLQETNGLNHDDVIACATPIFPMHGYLTQPGISVHVGATLLLMDRFDPAVFSAKSRAYPITCATFAPAMVVALLQLPEGQGPVLDHARLFFCGGAALHPEVRERFEKTYGAPLVQGFGSTEVMGAIAMERAGRRAPPGSCGSLWPGAKELVRVVDDEGHDVPLGEIGEFLVHKSRATMGYWRRPDLTEEAFYDDTWFKMGDVGRIDENDFVFLLDRKKDMIIRGGFNIYSAEIERVLNQHDLVAEATVIGLPHERLGEVPKAFVVLRSGTGDDALAEELRAYCIQRIGKLKAPEEIEFVAFDALPRNAMTKVLKRELRDRVLARARG